MSRILVDQVRSNSASSDALTLDGSGNITVPGNITLSGNATLSGTATGFPDNRKPHNLIINGSMNVAQRSAGPNEAQGYGTVDRFKVTYSGQDQDPSQAQVDVASGTTPYTLGFRKALRVINGNQTSGAGSNDHIRISTTLEGQDIANSGWNYVSSSSNITLSFWVKSSVAQNFYGFIRSTDGTMQQYPFETGSLSADTWTKVTKTIPGNSNLTFNNDTGGAFELWIHQFAGTDQTSASVTLNAWAAYNGSAKMPDNTSTWYTTNDATFELTGVQLEVGSVATDFEHLTFGDELLKCQRYYFKESATYYAGLGYGTNASSNCLGVLQQPCVMRATPTASLGTAQYWGTGPSGGGQSASYSYVYGSTSVANGPRVQGYELSAEL